jgi:hypothetical protein
MAALGLLDKFAGAAAVLERKKRGTTREAWRLRDGGPAGFYCETRPTVVRVNDREVPATYAPDTGLLTVPAPAGAPVTIEIGL